MRSDTPLISVIMTVYNGEHYLADAIESIQRQSLARFEFVIVDDGSTDSTPAILARTQSDRRIHVISGKRIGRARALNVAWRTAQGSYIAVLDADDLAKPERLAKQLAFLQANPNVGVLGTACILRYEDDGTERLLRNPLHDDELRRALIRRTPFVHSSVMVRRSVLTAVGGYNESARVLIDSDLWVRAAEWTQFANLPDVLTVKRHSPHAFFRHRVARTQKCWAKMCIRWSAWSRYSRKPRELPYVFLEPPLRWLYGASRSAWLQRERVDEV